jgi:queuosine precursor transporter
MKFIVLALFMATIPLANWLISNIGTSCVPNGPCLIPVGFGLTAPSGVLMVGAALVLRDIVHELYGWRGSILAVVFGAAFSWAISSPYLAVASGLAFLLSELADTMVYAPLRKQRFYAAVLLSGLVGSVVDSAIFLLIAFGSLEYLAGQIVGKAWMTMLAIPVIVAVRTRLFPRVAR